MHNYRIVSRVYAEGGGVMRVSKRTELSAKKFGSNLKKPHIFFDGDNLHNPGCASFWGTPGSCFHDNTEVADFCIRINEMRKSGTWFKYGLRGCNS